jgi:hypothetical protein
MIRLTSGLICAAVVALSVPGHAADETLLRVSATGHIAIVFADGVRAEMLPVVQGPRWAYSDCNDGQVVKGSGTDLFKDGLTITAPVRDRAANGAIGGNGGRITIFAQYRIDPQDPAIITFKYRFAAENGTTLNALRLTLNLPLKPYAGMHLESVEGPVAPAEMPAEATPGGHLLNASARGAEISADNGKHGFRIVLDAPAWCIVDDERRWTGNSRYSIGLHAVCAADGTTLAAGQTAEISGTIGFDAPVRVVEDEAYGKPPATIVGLGFVPEGSDPTRPALLDRAGVEVASFETWLWGTGRNRTPEPLKTDKIVGKLPEPVQGKTRLYADNRNSAGFELTQMLSATPMRFHIGGKLLADSAFEFRGLAVMVSLSAPHFDGAKLTFVGKTPTVTPLTRSAATQTVVHCPGATGFRIERDGALLLAITGDQARRWDLWPQGERKFVLQEWLSETPAGDGTTKVAPGMKYDHELVCKWGGE